LVEGLALALALAVGFGGAEGLRRGCYPDIGSIMARYWNDKGFGFGIGCAGILLGERLPLGGIGSSEMLRFPQGLEILGDPKWLCRKTEN
jgi:hypothetical protein